MLVCPWKDLPRFLAGVFLSEIERDEQRGGRFRADRFGLEELLGEDFTADWLRKEVHAGDYVLFKGSRLAAVEQVMKEAFPKA